MSASQLLRTKAVLSTALLLFFSLPACQQKEPARTPEKPRIVVTADPELDDLNSLIRFILYSTDMQIEGLVYASSQFHWKGDGKGTKLSVPGREYTRFGLQICPCESWRWAEDERFIQEVVEAYEKVYPNLKVHNAEYPSPEELKSKIRFGNIEFDGDISKDSPGSDLIKSLILDDKPGKLFLTAWGGQSTIARALKSIQEEYEGTPDWETIRQKVYGKVVILPSGDQDDTYRDYIQPNWSEIDYRQFRGGPRYSYGAQLGAAPGDSLYLTPAWLKENVSDRGPLGEMYRLWGDGKQMVEGDIFDYFGMAGYTNEELKDMGYVVWMPVQEKGSWLGEGDNPTFMNMLDNGLRAYEHGSYGGWGGRQVPENENLNIFQVDTAAMDSTLEGMMSMMTSATSQARRENSGSANFFLAAQHDFSARLKWSVTPRFEDANHEPKVEINGPLNIQAKPGEEVRLAGSATDPDGDQVSLRWWQYPAGTYPKAVPISNPVPAEAVISVPADIQPGQSIHIILEATDNGTPALTRYQRVIISGGGG